MNVGPENQKQFQNRIFDTGMIGNFRVFRYPGSRLTYSLITSRAYTQVAHLNSEGGSISTDDLLVLTG